MSYSFLINGLIEGSLGLWVWKNPSVILPPKTQIDNHGRLYASLFAPMITSMSFASILMYKQPESDTKQIFGAAWMLYHVATGYKTVKDSLDGHKMANIPAFVHVSLAIWFFMYLKNQQFNVSILNPFKNT